MYKSSKDPDIIIKEKGLVQITNEGELQKVIVEVISKNTKSVDDFKSGKESALMFLMGQVMKITKGKANPKIVQELLRTELEKQ